MLHLDMKITINHLPFAHTESALKRVDSRQIVPCQNSLELATFMPVWWYIYEMAQSLDFDAPTGVAHPKRILKRKRDLEEELSDPPCSLRSAGKRVRSFMYQPIVVRLIVSLSFSIFVSVILSLDYLTLSISFVQCQLTLISVVLCLLT